MGAYTITILPGDGIGNEITRWGKAVLERIGKLHGHTFTFHEGLIGHQAIEATGTPLPDETLAKCRQSDAVLMGAVGDPRYDHDPSAKVRPEQGLLKIRKELGLFANIRPIRLFDQLLSASSLKEEVLRGTDIMFFRELTGDIYFGKKERSSDGNSALDTMEYSKIEVERIARMAFESARQRDKRLCSVDKANVLECSRLWRETVQQLASEYPDVAVTHMFVDNAAMQLIKDPRQFDVVLTGNMFGDILTDEASQISGSLGLLPSASLGAKVGLYEPVHGSAPDIAGKNIANPMALILSTALLLELSLQLKEEADQVIKAVDSVLADGFRTSDIAGSNVTPLTTDQMGEKIIEFIK